MIPSGTEFPHWYIIVRRDKPELYQHLRENFEPDARVEVILDRRRAAPTEMPAEAEARRAERRRGEQRASAEADRRQAERRQPLARPQHEFWVTEGFFMVRRATDEPRA